MKALARFLYSATPSRRRQKLPVDMPNPESLKNFRAIVQSTACPFASKALLWGAPAWESSESFEGNVARLARHFDHFVEAAAVEPLDGFVVEVAEPFACGTMRQVAGSLAACLELLVTLDLRRNQSFVGQFVRPGWQFEYANTRLFVSVFSPLYTPSHQRFSPRGTYIMFQPEASFRHHKVGGPYRNARRVKEQVRRDFTARGFEYMTHLIDKRVEAPIYLLPRFPDDRDAEWWRMIRTSDGSVS